MKKYLLVIIVIIVIIIIGIGIYFVCTNNKGDEMFKKKEINSIKELEYSASDGRTINAGIHFILKCDDKCILYSKYEECPEDEKIEVEVDKKYIDSLVDLFNKYNVSKWDGFNKSDKYVLDGTSYSFKVVTKDDVKVYASGYMKYPKNYREVINKMIEIFDEINDQVCFKLFSHENYKGFDIDNVSKVIEEFYGEGGLETKEYTEKNEIQTIYNRYDNYKIVGETKQSCVDNTKVYKFIMKDGKEYKIEQECEWIIINNKRYLYTYA